MQVPAIDVSRVYVREIAESDKETVALLLAAEFRGTTTDVWLELLEKLARHKTPAGMPKYGYFMKNEEGAAVGVILTISSVVGTRNVRVIRCNLSCWCVAPAYRALAHPFVKRVLNKKDITYINISPAPHTLQLIQLQGFLPYCTGVFYAIITPFTSLSPSTSDRVHVEIFSPDAAPGAHFETFEYDLLQEHAESGCQSLWCVTPDRAHPFVFRSRLLRGFIPYVHLIYCRSIDEFTRFAAPIGRFLTPRRKLFIALDANGRIPGLLGVYRETSQRFFRGPEPPKLGDLAYTELALFGI
jgi:hypothetical protein